MRFIGFLAILLFSFADTAWSQSASCRDVESRIQNTATHVKKNFKERDVAPDVDSIEQLVTACKVNIAKFGWVRGIFDYWKNTGYETELYKAKEQAEYYAKFKDVSPELERYRRYASKLKLNPQEINGYISKYRTQGLASARAEEMKCQPAVDLRNQALGEVRDQDSMGWCYAFAGADLLTYKLGRKVSAVDVAMNYNDKWFNNILKRVVGLGERDFKGATPEGMGTAIANTKAKGGACLEANLTSEDNGYSSISTNLFRIENLKKNSGTLNSMTCPGAVQLVFPTIQAKEFLEIFENASRANLISMLSDKACKPRLSLKGVEVEYTSPSFFGDTTEVLNQIDRQLNRKNILALTYNAELLFDRNSKKDLGHVSTIVGRRFNKSNGECEYLVRNSWGRGCSSYDPYYTCESGNIWMPKSVVSKGVINVGFIK